jgi:hypothetical protein
MKKLKVSQTFWVIKTIRNKVIWKYQVQIKIWGGKKRLFFQNLNYEFMKDRILVRGNSFLKIGGKILGIAISKIVQT